MVELMRFVKGRSIVVPVLVVSVLTTALVIFASQRSVIDAIIAQLRRDPWTVHPLVWAACALLGGALVVAASQVIATVRQYPAHFTWPISRRMVGWMGAALSSGLIALGLLISLSPPADGPLSQVNTASVVETIVSLILGIQIAVLFSPDEEASLELLLTYPRPLGWLVLERFAVAIAYQLAIGFSGSLAAHLILRERSDLFVTLIRWLPPALLLAGVGLRVTLRTRQIVLGVSIIAGLWFGVGQLGDAVLSKYPFLWPLHLFLSPERLSPGDYMLNRLVIALIGCGLLISGIHQLRDEQAILSSRTN
jgi:hypothetical protein